jgi:hypothetical protein
MSPEQALAARRLADLSRPHSSLRLDLYLSWLLARARGEHDHDELPGDAARRDDPSPAQREEARAKRVRAAESSAIDESDRAAAGAEPRSRLDSEVITDRALETKAIEDPLLRLSLRAGDHDPWLVAVEGLTAPYRAGRARAHRRAASLAMVGQRPGQVAPGGGFEARGPELAPLSPADWQAVLDGVPLACSRDGLDSEGDWGQWEKWIRKDSRSRRAHWHWGRGRGQVRRFGSAAECGTGKISALCSGCGIVHEHAIHCGLGVICVPCRARKAKHRNRRFAAAQKAEQLRARQRALYRHKRRGGRWGERFVTLTIPHVSGDRWEDEAEGVGTVGARVRLLFSAWRAFSLRLQGWGRKIARRDGQRIAWYRAFEWTLGADEKGHPHFHLWLHSPILPEADVAKWWAAALTGAGCPVSPERVIVSVRGARADVHRELTKGTMQLEAEPGGGSMVRYIEGWSIRDVDDNGRRVSPEVAAALYAALDGRRLVQTSRGLLEPRAAGCRLCHALRAACVTVTRPPPTAPPTARGPPNLGPTCG